MKRQRRRLVFVIAAFTLLTSCLSKLGGNINWLIPDVTESSISKFALDKTVANNNAEKHDNLQKSTRDHEVVAKELLELKINNSNLTKEADDETLPTEYNDLFNCPAPPKWLRQKGRCQFKKNVLFLKTRRTGSGTVQNIMFRYGEKNNLNFVLPSGGNQFGGAAALPFHKSQILKSNISMEDNNILCHQARFSEFGFSSVMPDDSAYVTIIRDPTTQFESVFTHMQIDKLFKIPGSDEQPALKNFLERPESYFNIQPSNIKMLTRNPMLFDLGISYQDTLYLRQINKYIQYLDSKFDFVMLTEFFDESLILLKKFLCLNIEDITYFEHNVRSAASKFVDTSAEGLDSAVNGWNLGDTRLYQYFREKMLCLIKQYGENKMESDVMKLREMNDKLYDFCVAEIQHDSTNVWSPSNVRAIAYKLKKGVEKNTRCVNMIKSEHIYTRELRNKYIAKIKQNSGLPMKPKETRRTWKKWSEHFIPVQ